MDPNFEWHTRDEKLLVVDYWWKEQRGLCFLCGELMKPFKRQHSTDPDAATVEHVIPRRENGPNTAGNVRLAHASCNNVLGALWEQNRHRAIMGLPPISEKQALASAAGNRRAKAKPQPQMTPLEQARSHVDKALDKVERKAKGVKWCAQNAVSLPRGATLLPGYHGLISGKITVTKKATKMTPIEVARWLAQQGIRGA
jgi:hypothetical protein